MTEPLSPPDPGRRTQVVDIKGHSIVVRELMDLQIVHIMRYARILQSPNVSTDDKMEAVDQMLTILHNAVVQESDLAILVEAEKRGDVTISDMLGFLNGFQSDVPAKPVVRRGRAAGKR